jgi:hypothetical protein
MDDVKHSPLTGYRYREKKPDQELLQYGEQGRRIDRESIRSEMNTCRLIKAEMAAMQFVHKYRSNNFESHSKKLFYLKEGWTIFDESAF